LGFRISTKNLAFATIMGALGLAMQLFVPGIPLGMGKIELADLPAILGATFTGPIGGAIAGFLYGISSGVPLALAPAETLSFAVLGYLSKNMKMKWLAIPIVRVFLTCPLNSFLIKIIYYGAAPLYVILIRSLYYNVPSVIISVPLCIFIEKKIPLLRLLE